MITLPGPGALSLALTRKTTSIGFVVKSAGLSLFQKTSRIRLAPSAEVRVTSRLLPPSYSATGDLLRNSFHCRARVPRLRPASRGRENGTVTV